MAETMYDAYCNEVEKNEKLEKEYMYLKKQYHSLTNQFNYLNNNNDAIIDRRVNRAVDKAVDAITKKFEDKVISLTKEVDHLRSLLNIDSTNSGLPTSKTPINKNKHIPNSRVSTGKKKGGQLNHKKHKLEKFVDKDITDTIHHEEKKCPNCQSTMKDIGVFTTKDEFDFEIIVKKKRHYFHESECSCCGKKIKVAIPNYLKEENQYGSHVQALALSLTNEGYVSMNRTKDIISGLTQDQIRLSEGYIAKLQKRLAKQLEGFEKELKQEIIKMPVMHWDDTVIMISTNRACLRFYGNEEFALYTSHTKKDKEGIDEDGILLLLDKDTVVVHDHNKVNYNDDYQFQNAECCVHLLRDLKKVVDNLQHEWPKKMVELLLKTNAERKVNDYVDATWVALEYDTIVSGGWFENLEDYDKYHGDKEEALLKRLEKYKENYLMWTFNSEIPFSNNVSERGLRSSKTKMKVSGQFQNLGSAEAFAKIKSYIETGKRHGMNSIQLISSALEGNAVSIQEMKKQDNQND